MGRRALVAAELSPLLIPDFPAKQLADLRLRQHVPKLDVAWHLVGGKPVPAPPEQVGAAYPFGILLQHDNGLDPLSHLPVRDADGA